MITLLARFLHQRLRPTPLQSSSLASSQRIRPAAAGSTAAASSSSPPPPNNKLTTPEGNSIALDAAHISLPNTHNRRVIIVGDVHGCAGELRSLLDRCFYRRGVDILIFVGDLVNKGPASADVVRFVADEQAYAVRGNHDDLALAAYINATQHNQLPTKEKLKWVATLVGTKGAATVAQVLQNLPLSIHLPSYGVTIVHAGVVPGVVLEQQQPQDLLKMRDVVPESCLDGEKGVEEAADESDMEVDVDDDDVSVPKKTFDWDTCLTRGERLIASERRNPGLGRAWASVYRGPSSHIFFGHDASRRLQLEPWATGLDAGCVYGGQLYAAVLPALDERGEEVEGRAGTVRRGAQEIVLGTGKRAFLVSVPATMVHSPPKTK